MKARSKSSKRENELANALFLANEILDQYCRRMYGIDHSHLALVHAALSNHAEVLCQCSCGWEGWRKFDESAKPCPKCDYSLRQVMARAT